MNKLQKIKNICIILQNEDEALTDATLNVLKKMEVNKNGRTERLLHKNDRGVITLSIAGAFKKSLYSNKTASGVII